MFEQHLAESLARDLSFAKRKRLGAKRGLAGYTARVSFIERDLLRRLIQDFARMLAALVARRKSGELQTAEQELDRYAKSLLGQLALDAERLDSESLSKLLKPERLRQYALLIVERGHLRSAQGRQGEAAADRARGLELLLEVQAKAPDPDVYTLLQELRADVDPAKLTERYRERLHS